MTLHYLDNGATTPKPPEVLKKILEYYTQYCANIHRGLYPISEKATSEYEAVRGKVAKFIGAKSENEIIFNGGTTDGINMVSRAWGENNLKEGDEIVVTEMEHHSNLVPWIELSKKLKLKINFLEIKNYELKINNLEKVINKKTKLLAVTQVSNVLGTINPIKEIIIKAREINPDICVVVDGAQAVGHMKVDVTEMDVDFYAFSGHKMYGPTGVGVLYGKAKRLLQMRPDNFGGGMIKEVTMTEASYAQGPEKFEAGTPPIAQVIGLGAAVDFLQNFGMDKIRAHEKELANYLITQINKIEWLQIMGMGIDDNRLGVVSVYSNNPKIGTSHDMADIMGRDFNVCVRAGHHCAMPLHTKFGVETGTVRTSLGIYNTKEDIDELIKGFNKVWTIFIKK